MNPDSTKMKVDQTEPENLVARKEIADQELADHPRLIGIEISQCTRQSQ